jgi:drug/metabolite transporter (DMT)-like permease
MGFFILGNRLGVFEIVCLFIAFAGVIVLILGATEKEVVEE